MIKISRLIGIRPLLSKETRAQIRDIMNWLNENAVNPFTPMQTLVLIVDRAWSILFPDKASEVKRKKYETFPF